MTLLVRRDQEYICRVRLTKVEKRFAVGDILPGLQQGTVIKGDSVIAADSL